MYGQTYKQDIQFSFKKVTAIKRMRDLPEGILDGLIAVLAGATGATARNGADRSTARQGQGKTFEIIFSDFLSFTTSFSFPLISLFFLSGCDYKMIFLKSEAVYNNIRNKLCIS